MLYYIHVRVGGEGRLENKQLSVAETLKFARHDFLNELQLILMHIDLGQLLEAKNTIHAATGRIRQTAVLDKLGLPKTAIWLSTFSWRFASFTTTVSCDVRHAVGHVEDELLVDYLEAVFQEAVKQLDVTAAYELQIDVHASKTDWFIRFQVDGPVGNLSPAPVPVGAFSVDESISHNQWMFTVRGQ
ncbi:Spo0B domain-containing protein [Sporosarcina sp. 179-K 3D1 HS]|uniref:Spo0B domain-containing protein n=1 Tax=Sporosarcina sp. 179-K 3D1 HS TaxID=3232169 RepID=UPI0039A0B764